MLSAPDGLTAAWARSGGMYLTGRSTGPPLDVAGAPATSFSEQLGRLAKFGGEAQSLPGVELIGERAALVGLSRRGGVSAGGACHMLRAGDGWWALSLPRATDVATLPALLEAAVTRPWHDLAAWSKQTTSAAAVARARLLDLAAAEVPSAPKPMRRQPVIFTPGGPRRQRERPRVVDLSSLWAGPLCAHLLGLLGAEVIKVESVSRPDGARSGNPDFYNLLHAGHKSVALRFDTLEGRLALRRLVRSADVVIEASRPRALQRLGIIAHEEAARGAIWASITAYGRYDDAAQLVGFGDDVAAGAGLVGRDHDGPVFAADALADPLTGVQTAIAVAEALAGNVGCVLDASMHDICCYAANIEAKGFISAAPASPPRARLSASVAPRIGEHTSAILCQL